ncbi:hypothetical protein ACSAZK_12320 [Methanosarcina sp. Mfa9]|uniref:hypothetical protein n=1 Tax=Methanosarcina sp. Mfa9 TaxID=3439063 RepID=UPI003F84099B
MNKYAKILFTLGLLVVISIVLFYGGLALLLFSSDMASYNSDDVYLGPVDFVEVLENAENEGYEVRTRWMDDSNGFEPGNVEEVAGRFDTDFLVSRVEIHSDKRTYLEVNRYQNVTSLGFINQSHASFSKPLEPSEFPDERWMLDMIGLMLGLDEAASEEYLEELRNEAKNQTGFSVRIEVNETLDFPAVYAYLNEGSTDSVFNPGMWNDEEFLRNGERLGYVAYLVPEATISTKEKFNEYSIDISSEGFARLDIKMHRFSAGKEIPEEEYRAVFRGMFGNLGLSPEKVDEFEFEYSPSVW